MKKSLFLALAIFALISAFSIQHNSAFALTWTYYGADNLPIANPTAEEITSLAAKRTSDTGITQYSLEIIHDFSGTWGTGYLENIGNPVPAAGKHWITANEKIAPQVDGIVQDVYNINSRFITTAYRAKGSPNQGLIANAIQFDGVDDYISVNGIGLNNVGSFTVEFWARRDTPNRDECLFGQGVAAPGQGIEFGYWESQNNARVHLPGWIWARTNSPTDTAWHQWRVEYSVDRWPHGNTSGAGFHIRIYRDNQLVSLGSGDVGDVGPACTTTQDCRPVQYSERVCRDRQETYKDGCDEKTRTVTDCWYETRSRQDCWNVYNCTDRAYTGTGTFYIGKGIGGGYFKGQMKDIAIKVNGQPVGRWQFNDGNKSAAAADSSGYNRTAALNNLDLNTCWVVDPAIIKVNDFTTIQSKQVIPEFTMIAPSSIVYDWGKQVAVTVITTPESRSSKASLKITDKTGQDSQTGSGKFWYKLGTAMKLSSDPDDCMQLMGYKDNLGADPNKEIPSNELVIGNLESPVGITWVYSQYIYEESVTIGNPLSFSTVPLAIQQRVNLTKKPLYKTDAANQVPEDQMLYWSPPESKLFPVKPDQTFQLEWEMSGACPGTKLITKVTTKLPDAPHYIHVAETPPVNLDASADDLMAFKAIKYTDNNAAVSGKAFSAAQPGISVLVFTRGDTISNTEPKEVSLTFNGGTGYADAGIISLNRGAFTVEFWAKRASLDFLHAAVGQGTQAADSGLLIGFNPDNTFMFSFFGNDLKTAAKYTDTDWHHWACSYEAITAGEEGECFQCVNDPSEGLCRWYENTTYTKNFTGKSVYENGSWQWNPYYYANRCTKPATVMYKRVIYRDGVKVAEDTTALPYKGTGSLRIGSTGEGWNPPSGFNGKIDEVRIWEISRTSQMLAQDKDSRLKGDEEGLIGYWRFDNIGESFEKDSRILANPADNAPEATDPLEQPKMSRTCLSFNGTDNYVLMNNPFTGGINFTIEMWVNPELVDGNSHALVGWQDETGKKSPTLYVAPSGGLVWDSYNAAGTRFTGTIENFFSAYRWVHVAWVKNGTTYSIYKNGVLVKTDTAPDAVKLFSRYSMGKVDTYFKGQLDEVRMWNTARAEADIKASLNAALTGNEAGLAAYYPIDTLFTIDRSTVTDLTANKNNGVMTNMIPSSATVPSPAPGPVLLGNALSFDGVDDYVQAPEGVWFNGDFTVESWVYVRNYNIYSRLIDFGNGPESDNVMIMISANDTGRLGMLTIGATRTDLTAPNPIPKNTWTHVAVTLQGTTARIYMNGVEVASKTDMAVPRNVVRKTNYIGKSNWGADKYADAIFDELRIWSVSRSQAEIQNAMGKPLAGNELGLKAYYDFNQTSGTVLPDKTAAAQNGTLINMATAAPVAVSDVPAVGSKALVFDGVDDNVDLGSWFNYQTFTLSMWVKPGATQVQYADILDNNHNCNQGWVIQQDNLTTNRYVFSGGVQSGCFGNAQVPFTLNANQWQHMAVTFDGITSKVYVNGSLAGTGSGANIIYNNTQFLRIGSWGGGGRNWNGQMDELSIWNVVKSQAEIQNMLKAPLTGTEAGLLAYYDFNQVTGSTLADKTGNHNGTLVNMIAWVDGFPTLTPTTALSSAMSFDGVDDVVRIPNSPSLNPTDAITIEGWIKPMSYSTAAPIMCKSFTSHIQPFYQWGLIHLGSARGDSSGKLEFNVSIVGKSERSVVWSDVAVPDNVWSHVAGVYDGTAMKIYINGELRGMTPLTGKINTFATDAVIGQIVSLSSAYTFKGSMDEVRMWSVARSQTEIKNAMSKTLAGTEAGLAAYYNFDNKPFADVSAAKTDVLNFGANSVFFTKSMYPFTIRTYMAMGGGTSYMEIPDSASLNLSSDLTVEAWINLDKIADAKVAGKADSAAKKGYVLGVSSTGALNPEIWDTDGVRYAFSLGKIEPGQWTHVAMTWKKGGKLTGYINGFKVGEVAAGAKDIGVTGNPLRIGAAPWDPSLFKLQGKIDDVRIWNIERSQADVKTAMMQSLTGKESGLVAFYNFDGVQDTRLADKSSLNNKGVIIGATFIQEGLSDNVAYHPLKLVNMEPSSAWSVNTTKLYEGSASSVADKGIACVRVVETIPAESDKTKTGTAIVGSELTSDYHGKDVPHNGYVFREIGPYNADIYDRQTKAGSIYPVNSFHPSAEPKEDRILVVWYRMQDNIAWSYQAVDYTVEWPKNSMRVVAASRVGSEGKNKDGADQTYPDIDGFAQNYADPQRYQDMKIYNQPDKVKPGYNPNEEHGLIAASFRHSQAAPQPVAAFALRNDLNITSGDGFTSQPFVLAQYYDLVLKKHGMVAYKVEIEDSTCGYTFKYDMKAGEPVVAPYPVNTVIGAAPPSEIFGKNGDPAQKCYWEDHKGQPWVISGAGKTVDLAEVTETSSTEYKLKLASETFLQNNYYLIKVTDSTGPVGTYKFLVGGAINTRSNESVHIHNRSATPGDVVVTVTLKPGITGLSIANFKLYHYTANSHVLSYFWYPLDPTFWINESTPGNGTGEAGKPYPFLPTGKVAAADGFPTDMTGKAKAREIRYDVSWPDDVAILKAGETLTFSGGEYRTDNTDAPGLPGVLGWAAGQVVFDELNPKMDETLLFTNYQVRMGQVLDERSVTLKLDKFPDELKPAAKRVDVLMNRYYFKDLHAGLRNRICYDPTAEKLIMKGFVNDKTVGDKDMTAAPPAVYVVQPDIMTETERDTIKALEGASTEFKAAVDALYAQTRNPKAFTGTDKAYAVGIDSMKNFMSGFTGKTAILKRLKQFFAVWLGVDADITNLTGIPERFYPEISFGPGLALMPNAALLDPATAPFKDFTEGFVTLAENNHPDLDALPVALHIVKVKKDKYRGAIKTVFSDNVFDEKITLRHTADFGGKAGDLVFQWWYREEDGTAQPTPSDAPAKWKAFPDLSGKNGVGMSEIALAGAGSALLSDNLFFARYRHKSSPELDPASWSNWAGAANSRPPRAGENAIDTYQAQLCEGWIKRVLNGVNPFEARIKNFTNTDSPATYVSMIQQAGQRYEGPVAFNPQKDVIENVGLIELYQTVLERGKSLSINLSQPVCTSGVTSALMLAASRISGFYTLLGNEAYNDALDPTIGFGTKSVEYGSLAPTIFAFTNQVPTLLDEELGLLRGRSEAGARPVYNRLMWNFTKDRGEAAYAMNYNITDVTKDGFINDADGQKLYPQGHGDAWGHYLTAVKSYYDLLRHPEFKWESRSEKFQIQGVVMDVDYLDERKFAEAAGAKAKVGKEIVDLTYRSKYVDDPEGQWQGYEDTDKARAWGVSEWSRRAFLGAYFDWAEINTILPSAGAFRLNRSDLDRLKTEVPLAVYNKLNTFEDQGYATQDEFKTALTAAGADPTPYPNILKYAEKSGLKQIDRSTVQEILEIASQARNIQKHADEVNTGLNPLGLANDTVPFDIDPSRMIPGAVNAATQFEQVYERAVGALENARVIFDYANDLKNRIRQSSVATQEFTEQVDEQDRDYRNRLIETFGTPYEGVIGPGKVYPAGYQGPDYFLYNYIDVNEVSDKTMPEPSSSFKGYFKPMNMKFRQEDDTETGNLSTMFTHFFKEDLKEGDYTSVDSSDALEIEFPQSASTYSFQAPADWGMRKSPGEVQQALIELVKAEVDLQLALSNYDGVIGDVQSALKLLEAKSNLRAEEVKIGDEWKGTVKDLNSKMYGLRACAKFIGNIQGWAKDTSDSLEEGTPKVVGLACDPSFPVRLAMGMAGAGVQAGLRAAAFSLETAADTVEMDKEIGELEKEVKLQKASYKYEVQEQLSEIESALGNEASKRLEVFKAKETMRQVSEKYRSTLAKGLRLMEERKAFNAKVAAKTQGSRYMDMTFRLSVNDALSKYRSMFDVAARFAFLAAKAYDYETNLSDRDPASAKPMLANVMRDRTIGQYQDGQYIVGQGGLGDTLARLKANFDTLKSQMGLNNPQSETSRMSMRYELFRVKKDQTENEAWRKELLKAKTDNLWSIPEFRKYCRPFIAESAGSQPGLVIAFTSNVISGKNFFGWPLGGGDHAYDPTNFATKVRSVGVWFEGYDNSKLSETPRAYLIPAGMDYMLVANSTDMDSREWTIVDQKIPVPLPVAESDMANPNWFPSLDSLNGPMVQIRKYSSSRAYHDNGYLDVNQMSYDSRLIGRSVWNSRWLLIIPGATFHYDAKYGMDTFINTVTDIKVFFQTYAISGN